MNTLTKTVLLPTDFVMATWRPGGEETWSWADEISLMKSLGILHSTAEDYLRHPSEPIVLGGDGRVWEGSSRVVAAYLKGVGRLHCAFEFVEA